MKKKGFTLIELLAVIIILAIIALIATPIIMRVIENSKKSAAERSADNYIRSIETQAMSLRTEGTILEGTYKIKTNGNLCLDRSTTCNESGEIKIDMNGTKPMEGKVKLENGDVVGYSLAVSEYEITHGQIVPLAYQEVEYVVFPDTEPNYIKLQIKWNEIDSIDSNVYTSGSAYWGNGVLISHGVYNISPFVAIVWGINKYNLIADSKDYSNKILKISGITETSGENIYIGGFKSIQQASGKVRQGYATFKYNDQVVCDIVPCYRKSDNEIGVYDTINHVFYTNDGEGTLEIVPYV